MPSTNNKKQLPSVFDVKAKVVHFAEEGQEFKVQFAWAQDLGDNKYRQQHHWVQCRDFLGDWIYMIKYNCKQPVYGYQLTDGAVLEPYIGVRFPKISSLVIFLTNVHLLKDFCSVVKIAGRSVILKLDERCLKYIWRISLASFLIKVAGFKHMESLEDLKTMAMPGTEDCYREILGTEKLYKLASNWDKIENGNNILTYEKDDIHYIHHNNGFASTFKSKAVNAFAKQLVAL